MQLNKLVVLLKFHFYGLSINVQNSIITVLISSHF